VLRVLSLGAGVQSSTLALMIAAGEVPMVDAAIFADTRAEPPGVYAWLDWLEKQLPFPVYRVSQGDLAATVGAKRILGKFRKVDIPAFTSVDGARGGLLNRSCTKDYKIIPIQRKVRELVGLTRKRSPKTPIVTQLIGISLDEYQRMKPSRDAWVQNQWPLVDLEMTRTDCLKWMSARGYPMPSKSSCTFCPYHSDAEWLAVRNDPAAWAQAVAVDKQLRSAPPLEYRSKGVLFVHKSCKPLDEVVFKPADTERQVDMFNNECEGMCGV
jgi:hypothetical protein